MFFRSQAQYDSILIPLMFLIMKMFQLGCLWFQGMKTSKGTEATSTKDSLLKELSEHHHHAEQALRQKQLEEIKHSGLSPDLTVPKQTLHFLEEIPHQLSTCLLGLQIPDSNFIEQQVSLRHFLYATLAIVTSPLCKNEGNLHWVIQTCRLASGITWMAVLPEQLQA